MGWDFSNTPQMASVPIKENINVGLFIVKLKILKIYKVKIKIKVFLIIRWFNYNYSIFVIS